jgi:hypothetical protein
MTGGTVTYLADAAAAALAAEVAELAAAEAAKRADLEAHALAVLSSEAWAGSDPSALHVADVQAASGLVVFTDGHDYLAVTDTLGTPSVWLVDADPDGPDPADGTPRWGNRVQVDSLAALGEALATRQATAQATTETQGGDAA